MRILVDAMGGDNAPAAAALGAIRAAEALGTEVVLVGRGEEILKALADHQIQTLPKGVEIANADDVVDMHDDPATVLKKKPELLVDALGCTSVMEVLEQPEKFFNFMEESAKLFDIGKLQIAEKALQLLYRHIGHFINILIRHGHCQ